MPRSPFLPVAIAGDSMAPTLQEGEWWLAWRTPTVAPGDLVVFAHPSARGVLAVKRVVALRPAGLWVEGDNPNRSTDSRHFGALAVDRVLGRLMWRYSPWPPRRPGRRPRPSVVD